MRWKQHEQSPWAKAGTNNDRSHRRFSDVSNPRGFMFGLSAPISSPSTVGFALPILLDLYEPLWPTKHNRLPAIRFRLACGLTQPLSFQSLYSLFNPNCTYGSFWTSVNSTNRVGVCNYALCVVKICGYSIRYLNTSKIKLSELSFIFIGCDAFVWLYFIMHFRHSTFRFLFNRANLYPRVCSACGRLKAPKHNIVSAFRIRLAYGLLNAIHCLFNPALVHSILNTYLDTLGST